jgi:segregation and condensation protein B
MSDERPESLAEQAAGWVPPWDRPDYAPASARPTDPAVPEPEASPAETPDVAAESVEGEATDAEAVLVDAPADGDADEVGAVLGEDAVRAASSDDGQSEISPSNGSNSALTRQESWPEAGAEAADASVAGEPGDAGAALAGDALEAVEAEPADDSGSLSDLGTGDAVPVGSVAEAGVDATEVPGEAAAAVVGAAAVAAEVKEKAPEHALALIDDAELRGALEAILLVVDEPVSEIVLAQVLEQPTDRIAAMLIRIAEDFTGAGHGFELRRAAGGWRLYTRPAYAPYVERFVLDGQSVRLTQAALETLAVVAYKQPVTRSRISAIRGVNCDGVIRTLVSRGLVEECGTEPETGAHLYRTTVLFLEKLGLNAVDELPPLAPFLPDDVDEFADAQ